MAARPATPVANVWSVVSRLASVGAVAQPLVGHPLAQVRGTLGEPRHPVDDVHDQVEAVEVVEHHHVERRRGGSFFLVAPDMHVGMVGAPVGEAVDQGWVAVVGEDHRPVRGEERVELVVRETVGMLGLGLQAHQIDHVDHSDAQLGEVLAQQRRCGDRLQRGHVAGAGEHDIRL